MATGRWIVARVDNLPSLRVSVNSWRDTPQGPTASELHARHGATTPAPLEALTADDPDLYLVTADPAAWQEAHPCECEAECRCQ